MKLKFIKVNDVIETKLIINDIEQNFEYLTFINNLIDGNEIEEIIYPDDISNEEKEEIDKMIEQINEVIKSNGENKANE